MKNVIFFFLIVFTFISCRNEPARREYQEVSVQPASGLPSGHPPIDNKAVEKTAQTSSDLPPNHPPIGSMDMNDPAMKKMIAGSAVDAPIIWVTPDGWTELPGDGMRLATIQSPDGSVKIAVTSFGGQAGGVEGNIIRWLGQLGLNLDETALKAFIANSETVISMGQLNVRIFRFTSLAPDADSSMIAAMAEIPEATVFFKMTGTAKNLETHFLSFHEFCQSLELKS